MNPGKTLPLAFNWIAVLNKNLKARGLLAHLSAAKKITFAKDKLVEQFVGDDRT
jgi:hypothetical protein